MNRIYKIFLEHIVRNIIDCKVDQLGILQQTAIVMGCDPHKVIDENFTAEKYEDEYVYDVLKPYVYDYIINHDELLKSTLGTDYTSNNDKENKLSLVKKIKEISNADGLIGLFCKESRLEAIYRNVTYAGKEPDEVFRHIPLLRRVRPDDSATFLEDLRAQERNDVQVREVFYR